MKFSKRYIDDINEKQPEWRDKFLSYKELKRLIRLIIRDEENVEAEFMCLLNNEIDKFNDFFIEKEEDYIIRYKVLSIFKIFVSYIISYFSIIFLNRSCVSAGVRAEYQESKYC